MRKKETVIVLGVDTPDPHTWHDELWKILSIEPDNRPRALAYYVRSSVTMPLPSAVIRTA
jgi:hypothetical protein